MRSGYSNVGWFLRAARVVPVIAGAALLGGMIGGFAMFAIDSALTWDPPPQSRPDARADNAASAVNPQPNKPVRIVGGSIPDPSAGMSAPPPAPQPPRSAQAPSQTQSQTEVSSQLMTAKPLGPASHLQPQTATSTPNSAPNTTPAQNQTVQAPVQAPAPTQSAPATQQQTRWPDALSRAHQNAANGGTSPSAEPRAQQPTATPPAAAQTNNHTERAANADENDGNTSRQSRRSRRHSRTGADGSANGGDNNASAADSRRQRDARGYDRLYDSYGNRRDRSYGDTRQSSRGQSYGNAAGDQDEGVSRSDQSRFDQSRSDQSRSDQSRSDTRQYGRDTRYRGRSRVIVREQPDEGDRGQAFETNRPRLEPFWGGGFFRRGYRDDD
jgi:hypothetical protein